VVKGAQDLLTYYVIIPLQESVLSLFFGIIAVVSSNAPLNTLKVSPTLSPCPLYFIGHHILYKNYPDNNAGVDGCSLVPSDDNF
jgi:hypothetical protein